LIGINLRLTRDKNLWWTYDLTRSFCPNYPRRILRCVKSVLLWPLKKTVWKDKTYIWKQRGFKSGVWVVNFSRPTISNSTLRIERRKLPPIFVYFQTNSLEFYSKPGKNLAINKKPLTRNVVSSWLSCCPVRSRTGPSVKKLPGGQF
jgi:hypothetical protein